MSIFKACDIRGTYPDQLDETAARAIGRAVGTELDGADCVLAGDVRTSTPALKAAALDGLKAAGCHVVDLGIVPTPVAYWAQRTFGTAGALIVTASHNPPEYNGIKFMVGDLPVSPADVERVRRRVERGDFRSGAGSVETRDVRSHYLEWLASRFGSAAAGLSVVVDAGHGTMSDWAPVAFGRAGCNVVELFCTPDGRFPDRSPNPSRPEALEAAGERVRETGADVAACFDGDGDRVVFLDEEGEYVPPEETLILFVRHLLTEHPGAGVVYDLKCTRTVPREIKRAGGRPLMERSGHAFIKRRLLREDALMAGEASGHFFFREIGGDDGLYAALLMAQILAQSDQPLSRMRSEIGPYFISEDIRIRIPDGDPAAIVSAVKERFADRPQDHTDGVRVEFEKGWALCRPSVTEPAVTVRVEGDTPEDLERIRAEVLRAIDAAR
ncbi:MAG: phosphomannomutase/phosphoglucomutase [Candidatus Brocadiia bacterium]